MSITKPKLSTLVSGQLPEFVREDYPTFVAFIEAYYEYLESQTIVDFDTLGNIDTTLDSFVKYFKSEVALNFPTTLLDDKFLLPKLKELYISKGTEASYNLLFRILYNKEIEIRKPSKQMLRVSDGKWIQNVSIFATADIGTPDDIVGRTVNIISTDRYNIKKIKVVIDSYRTTDIAGVYEFFILNGFTGTFNIGDLLNYSTIFTGVITATTSTLTIDQPGKNFKVGQTYSIGGSGSGSVMKVESVDALGGIKTAKFISFGVGYPTIFTTNILALSNHTTTIQNYFTITGSSPSFNTTVLDSVDTLTDSGVLNLYNYAYTSGAGFYSSGSYAGIIAQSFANSAYSAIIDPLDYAKITVNLGPLGRYPGYYNSNDGFLDDTIYIQDSKFYQTFSYTIQIDELFDSYKSIVKNLIHPAGLEIIGEYNINNTFNANAEVGIKTLSYTLNLTTELSDQLITEDNNTIIVLA